MPEDGAYRLADLAAAGRSIVAIECRRCGRYGRYRLGRLVARHGAEIALPDLRKRLVGTCQVQAAFPGNTGCQAAFLDMPWR